MGGGLTGLSCALHLAERGVDVALLEARRLGWGASGRNGGQLLTGQRLGQRTLEKSFGPAHARLLWDLAEDAKASVRARIERHAIPCDLAPGALVAAVRDRDFADLASEATHLERIYGYDRLTLVPQADMERYVGGGAYRGGLWDDGGGHLHPLTYALGLARAGEAAGARLFENSRVLRLTPNGPCVLDTERGRVRASALVLATNGYHTGLVPQVDARILPINSFVGVTAPLGADVARNLLPRGGCVADTRFVLDYYRMTPDGRLLFGGGESYRRTLPRDPRPTLQRRIASVFPDLADVPLEYAWGGRLAVTRSRLPYFDRIGADRYVAAGFSGQGLALTTQAGAVMAEAIAGNPVRFEAYAQSAPGPLPGGRWLRRPLMTLAMIWAALSDRL